MFNTNFFCTLFLVLVVFFLGCRNPKKKQDLLVSNSCCEWELKKAKIDGKRVIVPDYKKIYLVFHPDNTYEYYHKKENGDKLGNYTETTDNIVTAKWKLNDQENKLSLTDFKNIRLLQLDEDKLVFISENITYYFVCSCKE